MLISRMQRFHHTVLALFLGLLCLGSQPPAGAQTVGKPVQLGTGGLQPVAVAVNPDTHRVYVTNDHSHSVSVFDGITDTLLAIIPITDVDINSRIAVNPVSNSIYVSTANGIYVIDGYTNYLVDWIATPNNNKRSGIAVDNNDTVYVISYAVNVVNGTPNYTDYALEIYYYYDYASPVIINLPGVTRDSVVSLNPKTNIINITAGDRLWVINGYNLNQGFWIPLAGSGNFALAVNAETNQIFVSNNNTEVMVLDGNTYYQNYPTISPGACIAALATDPMTDCLYIATFSPNGGTNGICVYNTYYNQFIAQRNPTAFQTNTYSLAVDPGYPAQVFTCDYGQCRILALNGDTLETIASEQTATGPVRMATNATTKTMYVANWFSNDVSVIDLENHQRIATIPIGLHPRGVCIDEATDSTYVAISQENRIAVIDGPTNTVRNSIPVNPTPRDMVYNTQTKQLYVLCANGNGIAVIDTTQEQVIGTISAPSPISSDALAFDPVGNQVFFGCTDGTISCIDGKTNLLLGSIHLPNPIVSLAYNPNEHILYIVSSVTNGQPCVTLLNIITGHSGTLTNWDPADMASDICVDPSTEKVYVADTGTDKVGVYTKYGVYLTSIQMLSPYFLSADPTTNSIYAVNSRDSLYVIDKDTNSLVSDLLGDHLAGVAYNPQTQLLYVANYEADSLSVENPYSAELILTLKVGHQPTEVTVDSDANLIYVANSGDNTVSVIDGATNSIVDTIPLASTRATTAGSLLGMVLDTKLKRLYVTDAVHNAVQVLDTTTKTPTLLPALAVGHCPMGVAVDLTTHRVFVTNYGDDTLSIIDGNTGTVCATLPVGNGPLSVAVNQQKHTVLVANLLDKSVMRIEGNSGTAYGVTGTTVLKLAPTKLAINETTDIAYVAHTQDKAFSALVASTCKALTTVRFDGTTVRSAGALSKSTLATTLAAVTGGVRAVQSADMLPGGVAVNSTANQVYFCDPSTTSIVTVSQTFNLHTITPQAGLHGAIDPHDGQIVLDGDSLTFTATPDPGYTVDSWSVDGKAVQTGGAQFTLNAITANHLLLVKFKAYTPLVTPSAGSNGSIAPSTRRTVPYNSSLTFTATPKTGYTVDTWTVSGELAQTGGTKFTLAGITSNMSVQVTFKQRFFTITPQAGSNGTISPELPQTVAYAGKCTFIATPATGYQVAAWWVDGKLKQTGKTLYALASITADHTVTVTFKLQTFTQKPSAGSGGTISPKYSQIVEYGSSLTFTATPGKGYEVDSWLLDGVVTQSGGAQFSLTNITAAHTVKVTFKKRTFTIIPQADANGALTPATPQTVTYGSSLTFTATPNAGYTVAVWTLDGVVKQTGKTKFTLTGIMGDHIVGVTFQ